MSDRPPFDPAPRPGEVASIVVRARRRKALRAVVPLSSVAVVALAASLLSTPTPRSDQQIRVADDPLTEATETAAPASELATASPPVVDSRGRAGAAAPSPAAVVPPPVGASPSPSRAPEPTRSPRPGERRPYRGELGPRIEEYGYAACRQSQFDRASSPTTMHKGFCIQPTFRQPADSGVSDLVPTLRLCWQAETVYEGTLQFRTEEEADFTLFDEDGRTLYRFSDTVTYTARKHGYRVLQGDCYVWSGSIRFDADRLGPGNFTLRLETRAASFAAGYRLYDLRFSV